MRPPNQPKKRFLICFSPRDAEGKVELVAHLAPLSESVSIWSVDDVAPGETTLPAFQKAAAEADAALLLLSSDFFAGLNAQPVSTLDTLPLAEQVDLLRQQHRERKLRLVPVLWRSCDWRAVDWLAKLKPLPIDGSAIAPHDKARRDQLWVEISQQLGGRQGLGVWGILSAIGLDAKVIMPDRATLLAKSRHVLQVGEEDFEQVVDVALGIHRVPQLVQAQHLPHMGTRGPSIHDR